MITNLICFYFGGALVLATGAVQSRMINRIVVFNFFAWPFVTVMMLTKCLIRDIKEYRVR